MKKDYLKLIEEFTNLEAELNEKEYQLLVELLKEHGSFIDNDADTCIIFRFSFGDGEIDSVFLKDDKPCVHGFSDSGNSCTNEIYAYSASEILYFCSEILKIEIVDNLTL